MKKTVYCLGESHKKTKPHKTPAPFMLMGHQRVMTLLTPKQRELIAEFFDEHGKQATDEVLARVASLLTETVRAMDLVARYAEDQFQCRHKVRSPIAGCEYPVHRLPENSGSLGTCFPHPANHSEKMIGYG